MKNFKKLQIIIFLPAIIFLWTVGWGLRWIGSKKSTEIKLSHKISYKTKHYIDILLPAIFTSFAIIWFIQSVYTTVVTQNLFSPIQLWFIGLTMHLTTTLSLTVLYLVNYFFFRTFLSGHLRVLRALLFTTFGVFFYDLIWSISNLAINGAGSFLIPLASTLAVIIFLLATNKQTRSLRLNKKYILPVAAIYVVSLYFFITSGFFQQIALYNQGIGSDPNGWIWLLNKTVTLWMWLTIASR